MISVSVRGNLFIAEMLFRVASQGNDLISSPVPFRRVSTTAAENNHHKASERKVFSNIHIEIW
jgi:hypothetical protein